MPSPDSRRPEGGYPLAGGLWEFQTMELAHGGRTVWVQGLHWPGCDDSDDHGDMSFGVQRDDRFLHFNQHFWDKVGVDYDTVIAAAARVHATGDADDVFAVPPLGEEHPELP